MKKHLLCILLSIVVSGGNIIAQCLNSSSVSDITLQCSGGTGNRTAVAYNPTLSLYYSVNAGSSGYPIETFSVTGGTALNSNTQGADYRGYWWNPNTGLPEGNTFGSGGVYSNTLNASGYALTTTSLMGSATMPNTQSCGQANFAGNMIVYYDAGTIYRYNKTTNALISSSSISGLPVATSNLNSYCIIYTGVTGSELGVYDYINRALYFLNLTTAAYTSSCSLPATAPNPATFRTGFAKNRFFLYDNTLNQWYGYPIINPAASPTLALAANNTSICSGNPVNINVNGANTYTWSTGSNSSSISVTPTITTVYSVIGSNTLGCTTTSTIAINVIQGAFVTASATPSAMCVGASAVLSATGVNSYTWNTNSNSSSITVFPPVTTAYTVQGTNSQGCVSVSFLTLTVNNTVPALTVSTSTPQTCLGKTITLTAGGALSYTWSNGVTNGSAFTPSVTNTYTVVGQNACGTTATSTTVSVNPLPMTVTSNPTVVCAGQSSTLSAVSAGTSYTWLPQGATSSTFIVSPLATSVYTVSTSDGTCRGVSTITLTTKPIPTVSAVASSTTICAGDVATLTASGGATYLWLPSNSSSPSITVSPTSASLYTVTATNTLGCFASTTQVVVVNSLPVITVSQSDPLICLGGSSSLTANGTATSYSWSTGQTGTLVAVAPTQLTNYSVTATDANNCSVTNTLNVAVFAPSVTISGPSTLCNGTSATLQANGALTYTWDNGSQFSSLVISPLVTTSYSLSATSTSLGLNCPGTASISVTVNPVPTLSVSATRSVICQNESVTVTASGANSYSWSTTSSSASVVVTSSLITLVNLNVTGTAANGCKSTASYQVKVNGCSGLRGIDDDVFFSVYPNPSNGEFIISFSPGTKLQLLNNLGQVIRQINSEQEGEQRVKIEGLAVGVYYLKGQKDGKAVNKTLMIE